MDVASWKVIRKRENTGGKGREQHWNTTGTLLEDYWNTNRVISRGKN